MNTNNILKLHQLTWYSSSPPTIHKTAQNKPLCERRLSYMTSIKLYQSLHVEYNQTLVHLFRGSCKDKWLSINCFFYRRCTEYTWYFNLGKKKFKMIRVADDGRNIDDSSAHTSILSGISTHNWHSREFRISDLFSCICTSAREMNV